MVQAIKNNGVLKASDIRTPYLGKSVIWFLDKFSPKKKRRQAGWILLTMADYFLESNNGYFSAMTPPPRLDSSPCRSLLGKTFK